MGRGDIGLKLASCILFLLVLATWGLVDIGFEFLPRTILGDIVLVAGFIAMLGSFIYITIKGAA